MKSLRCEDHEELYAALKALAQSTESESAPAELEDKLLLAFRRQNLPSTLNTRRFRPKSRLGLGLCAAAILAVAVPATALWISGFALQPVAPVALPAYSYALPAPPVADAPAYAPAAAARQKSAATREVFTNFLPLGYSGPDPDAYQVVRVKMDRSSLAQFGLPVNMDRAEEPVDADLLVGNDGVPRAVRFVSLVSSTSPSSQDWRNP